ncbi:MAG: DegQ family serine endoprotease [Gammaproteobacteria bacterium]|nr:DegQ family serine endoprotease [Gammaproteobacteria bacterium]
MKKLVDLRKRFFVAIVMLLVVSPVIGWAAVPLSKLAGLAGGEEPSLAPMLDVVTPAVVNISTKGHVETQNNPLLSDPFFRRFFNVPEQPRQRETQSLGSGVVVDAARGYVLTNAHVIKDADEITVTLRDRRSLKAKLVGFDKETDVAVIQVDPKKLVEVPFANSDKLRVGDFVVAIGNPFGLGQTVTSGIVSALGRSGLGIEGYEDFIQTDASINPGNSGGALVNLRGELVGINTAILSPGGGGNVGIGFAIPINMAKEIMQQLIDHGEVKRGRLGVYIQDLTPDLASAFGIKQKEGAVISQIAEGSSAQKAGLKAGDVIISVNEKPVADSSDLRNVIGLLRVGQQVDMEIVRNGKQKDIVAVILEQSQAKIDGEKISSRFSGAVFELTEVEDAGRGVVEGIQVASVQRGSPAASTGLREGDLIISVNRRYVRNFDELKAAVRQSSRRGILMNIQRGDGGLFLLIQ